MELDQHDATSGDPVAKKAATFDVEGAPLEPDGRRMRRDATMLPVDELAAQRHGTWVQGVCHIITVSWPVAASVCACADGAHVPCRPLRVLAAPALPAGACSPCAVHTCLRMLARRPSSALESCTCRSSLPCWDGWVASS